MIRIIRQKCRVLIDLYIREIVSMVREYRLVCLRTFFESQHMENY